MNREKLYTLSTAELVDLFVSNPEVKQILLERHNELVRAKQNLANSAIEHYQAERDLSKELATQFDELKKREQQAKSDPLTNLPNRLYLEEHFPDIHHAARRENQQLAVYMLDIDYFKKINDTYGHKAGDLVLKSLADILKTTSRETDIVSRLGGEEFCIVSRCDTRDDPCIQGERIRKAIDDLVVEYTTTEGDVEAISPTISIGCATGNNFSHENPLVTLAELQEHADIALYAAKKSGRNRVVRYEPILGDSHPNNTYEMSLPSKEYKGDPLSPPHGRSDLTTGTKLRAGFE
ncbi:GGDEF domain-containing protein [Candidatus Woesearchaeota archaeon]|nr:MAG: GGDEF domain-containing protein [Candidatus Woesearchaeota archaeon]